MTQSGHLLEQPLNRLELSAEFMEKCDLMGFKTLGDVLAAGPEEIRKKEAFSYHWLA
jgi:hypothetical protein